MKKKTLANYPSIPAPKVDQFTLPELASELLRNKQFVKGLQNLFSNTIITKNTLEPVTPPNTLNNFLPKTINSPTSSTSKTKRTQRLCHSSKNSESFPISQEQRDSECEFIFEQQVKNRMLYPWTLGQNGKEEVIECKFITDEITDFLEEAIEVSLHKVLNKEFINVTNQILAMRQEINLFTKEELQRNDNIRAELRRELERIQKKVQQQQHISTSILNQPLERFSRNKGGPNASLSSSSTKQSTKFIDQDESSISIHHEVFSLKKQIQNLKKSLSSQQQKNSKNQAKQLQQKIITTEQKLSELTLTLKLSLQQHKQKWKKSHEQLTSQLAASTSKEYIQHEVKKIVKSNLKIYLDEIMKCKKDIEHLYDRLQKNDKGIQEYIGNQLKNVWTLMSGIKTRIQNIEDQFNVGLDQSFVL